MNIIDGHCHILPCIDDGSQSLKESVDMLKVASSIGINNIICTPHFKHQFNNINHDIEMFKQLYPYAKKIGVDLAMGFEVHWKKLSKIGFENAKYFKLGKSNLFLLEFSYDTYPHNWESIVYNLQCQGLTVIIAHPERYSFVINDYSLVKSFVDAGCLIMTSGTFLDKSFLGRGKKIQKITKRMLKDGYIDMISTDAHSTINYDLFRKSYSFASKYGYSVVKSNKILIKAF